MTKNYEYKFEIKPGRFVYIPTESSRDRGNIIVSDIFSRWRPPAKFFHLGRKRGHLAAAKKHLENNFFGKRDIENFYGQVTRAKIARALSKIGFPSPKAFEMAVDSVVVSPDGSRRHLPYGFVQSPAIATLVLHKSALGRALINPPAGVTVTVFMDDIVYSANDEILVQRFGNILDDAASEANLLFSKTKIIDCSLSIEIFNCIVEQNNILLTEERMDKFIDQIQNSGAATKDAIIKYVSHIDHNQETLLSGIR